ncbi:hypothetical protein I546_4239 [Mycobacterium kansasii 732]|nr:hypothetical protein I546_4239 [Mycobacterium kansasii 732]
MTKHRPDFELNRPGALIAALPAILGFVPEKSLVLVSVAEGALGSVMRVDLSEDLGHRVEQLAEVAAAADPEAAIAVIVDADGAQCPGCSDEYRRVCDALTGALAQRDIVLWAAHVVDRIAVGGRWHCVDGCGSGGVIDDPAASPLAVAAVLDGRRLYPRRADLEAVVAVDDRARTDALAVTMKRAAAEREIAQRADPLDCSRRDVEKAMAAAARVADGQPLSDGELAQLGCALTDVRVRDTLYALAVGENSGRPSRCGQYWPARYPSRGGWRRWYCWRSVPTPAATVRWPGVSGDRATLHAESSDGRHAGHGATVRASAGAHPGTGDHRLSVGSATGRAATAAPGVRLIRPIRPMCGVVRPSRPSRRAPSHGAG